MTLLACKSHCVAAGIFVSLSHPVGDFFSKAATITVRPLSMAKSSPKIPELATIAANA